MGRYLHIPLQPVVARTGFLVGIGLLVCVFFGTSAQAQEFNTIQEAIDAAGDGTTILVAPGVYRERIIIDNKSLSLVAGVPNPQNPDQLVPGGHPFDHIIEAPPNGPEESVVTIIGGPGMQVRLEGFRVTGGRAPEGGGFAVRGEASEQLERCIAFANEATLQGGGIFVGPRAGLTLVASAVLSNKAEGRGGGIAVLGDPTVPELPQFTMVNSTVSTNDSPEGAVFIDQRESCLYNNILAGNEGGPDLASRGPTALVNWSVIGLPGPGIEPGQGTTVEPNFVADREIPGARQGNPRIRPGSPAIDRALAGQPPCFDPPVPPLKQGESDFEGDGPYDDPDTDNAGAGDPPYKDVGADEYMPIFIRADANADGEIDIGDPVSVLDYLFGGGSATCFDAVDSNDDGNMDIGDPSYTLIFLFAAGPAPNAPFPFMGADPTADTLTCTYYGAHP